MSALCDQLGRLVADDLLEQHEEAAYLVVGASPILPAEGVQREDRDPAPDGVADDLADPLDAGGVTLHLCQAPAASPAPIAVHDDRHVMRHLLGRNRESLPGLNHGRAGRRNSGRRGRLRRRRVA